LRGVRPREEHARIMTVPDFRSPAFLRDHIAWMTGFLHPRCIDPRGGFFHYYALDGALRDPDKRALVSSARMVVSFAMAARVLETDRFDDAIRHGLRFLRDVHRDPRTGGYAWMVAFRDGAWRASEPENQCYGMVHVMLAYAHAVMAGVAEARAWLDEVEATMDARLWEDAHGLYADVASADWSTLDPYRGQNANMHGCEALLAAYDATGAARHLERATRIARALCQRLAGRTGGLIWEHYRADWTPDWNYAKGDFSNGYRPWGFQPGHQTEWTKLLLQLFARRPEDWMLARARDLFDAAIDRAWDRVHGGLVYSLEPNLSVANADKYFWVQVESAAAAGLLARATGDESYWRRHDELWRYCWAHLVDHAHGSWHKLLGPDNARIATDKGSGGKDYHVIGACFDLLSPRPSPRPPS
jgi:mannose/cellobiose epimerase-like protein (N-acyl-D-glucosamine 2-epimerase family)